MSDPDNKLPKEHILWHQSGVSPTGQPFVQLLQDDQIIGQMTPTEARDHARAITEAAEAAEQDAFLVDFGERHLGSREAGLRLLMAFREYRAETGKSQGPRDPRDWLMPAPDKMPPYMRKDGGKPKP
jgi:hypothetical protein